MSPPLSAPQSSGETVMEQTRQAGAGRGLPPLCTMPSPGTRGQGLQASPSRWGIGGTLLEGPFRGRLRDWTELRGSRGRPLVTSDGWRCPGAGLCSALFPARVLFVQGPTSQLAWRRRRSGGSRSLLARAGLSQGSSLRLLGHTVAESLSLCLSPESMATRLCLQASGTKDQAKHKSLTTTHLLASQPQLHRLWGSSWLLQVVSVDESNAQTHQEQPTLSICSRGSLGECLFPLSFLHLTTWVRLLLQPPVLSSASPRNQPLQGPPCPAHNSLESLPRGKVMTPLSFALFAP